MQFHCFVSLTLLFGGVLHDVAVVVCLNSPMAVQSINQLTSGRKSFSFGRSDVKFDLASLILYIYICDYGNLYTQYCCEK